MARSGAAFVGREDELAVLAARRRECARGPRFVLIGGEAGVGKSRLLAEFRRTLQHRPVFFGQGDCDEIVPVPFGPFVEIFRALEPELARRLSVAPENVEHGTAHRAALFEAIRERLEGFGVHRTTVLFLEDLHFADNGTFELLLHLTRTVRSGRILLLATYRTEQLSSNEPLLAAVARLVRLPGVSTIELQPVSAEAARAIANAIVPAGIVLEPELVDEIVASSEGNAFFLEELVKSAADRARSGTAARALPGTIRSVIVERFATLSHDDRTVLSHAAILGRTFEIDVLSDVLGREHGELLHALRRARNAQLVVEDSADERRLAFRHALTRDAIGAEMLAAERRLLHARITTILEQRPLAYRQAHVADLAYHAFECEHGRASRYNEDAGDSAMAVHAYEDAARSYERALAAGAKAHRDRERLYRKAGDSLFFASHAARALRAYESALAACRLPADVDKVAALHLRIARQQYLTQNLSDAIASAQRALNVLTSGGSRALTDFARVTLASYHIFRLEAEAALRLTENVESLDDPDVAFLYHNVRMGAYAARSDLPAFRAEIPLFLAASERHPNPAEVPRAFHNVGDCAIFTGQADIAAQALARSVETSRDMQAHGMRLMCVGRLAFERYLSGELSHAHELVQSAILLQSWNVGVSDVAATAIFIGSALDDAPLVASGFRLAEVLLEPAFSSRMSQAFGPLAGASVEVMVRAKRAGEAQALLERVLHQIDHPYGSFMALLAAARHAAPSDLPRTLDLCRRGAAEVPNPLTIATAALVEGIVLARRGDADAAQRFARTAMRAFHDIGWRVLEADAAELCDPPAAAALYRAMGHRSGVRRVQDRRAVAGGLDENPRATARLSRRERDVVELVAAGKGNRAIAQALDIGEKTVEKHLSSAFGKLGVTSRTQLVAAVTASR